MSADMSSNDATSAAGQRGRVVGVILAGGLSRRMGGGDKGLLNLGGLLDLGATTMLDHVVRRVSPQVDGLVLNANGDPARFQRFGLAVVADPVAGFAGPLAGVLAGLRWAQQTAPSASHVLSVSADAPFLPADLVARLWDGLVAAGAGGAQAGAIAVARSDGDLHPVIGLWPVALADDLEAALGSGVRKVLAWSDRHGTVGVDFPMLDVDGEAIDPFFNANTPEDLDEARRVLARMAV